MNYEHSKPIERNNSLEGWKLQYEDLETASWFKSKVKVLHQIIFKG